MKKKGIHWFVDPIGSYTNGIISDQLRQMGIVNESISEMAHTYQGERINTFLVEREFIIILLESKKTDSLLKFRVFYSYFGNREVILYRNSKILYDENKSRLRTTPETKDKIKQEEKKMAKTVEELTKNLNEYQLGRKLHKAKKFMGALGKISETSKMLSKHSKELKKLFQK